MDQRYYELIEAMRSVIDSDEQLIGNYEAIIEKKDEYIEKLKKGIELRDEQISLYKKLVFRLEGNHDDAEEVEVGV